MARTVSTGILVTVAFVAGAATAAMAVWGLAPVMAQAPAGISRTTLLETPMSIPGYSGIVGRGEVAPGLAAPKHLHPGDELVVLLEGEVEVEMAGATPVRVRAGEAMHVPAGKAHRPKSVGAVPAKFISVWIVETGKPLAVNVP